MNTKFGKFMWWLGIIGCFIALRHFFLGDINMFALGMSSAYIILMAGWLAEGWLLKDK